jgi:hypothetical protein
VKPYLKVRVTPLLFFYFLEPSLSKGEALYLIAEKKREAFPGSLCTIFHETNYPQSKIFQSSNLPIFQSSGG